MPILNPNSFIYRLCSCVLKLCKWKNLLFMTFLKSPDLPTHPVLRETEGRTDSSGLQRRPSLLLRKERQLTSRWLLQLVWYCAILQKSSGIRRTSYQSVWRAALLCVLWPVPAQRHQEGLDWTRSVPEAVCDLFWDKGRSSMTVVTITAMAEAQPWVDWLPALQSDY
jgi:hypothetical protein